MSTWNDAFEARTDLEKYNDNGLSLFALALHFGVEDLETIAAEAITDGSDDKKCDMVYVNAEDGYAVLAQCYMSSKEKNAAPANKASDLNTAIGWLLQRQIDEVPLRIRSAAQEIRNAIKEKNIKELYVWYVHNLPESQNVGAELVTVQETAQAIFESEYPNVGVNVNTLEVGEGRLAEWYEETLSPILVNDEFVIDSTGGYKAHGDNWESFSTSIPARFLYRTYKKHKTKLFSANIRDYLGARSTDSNINHGIRRTIENDPNNFWVFNNGLTILTHNIEIKENNKLHIKGFSIVNGAQTTGAIGSLNKLPAESAFVQARFVATKNDDADLIRQIIQFNNSQNKVEASDFRSTDRYQKRLRLEFESIPEAQHEGGRRGGSADVIRRRTNFLPSYTVGQSLACFHQEPMVAYNQKSAIWVDDKLYSKYFNEQTKAAHIVCAYSLLKAVENKKKQLVDRSKKSDKAREEGVQSYEEGYLSYFRQRGSIFLFASAVVSCLETFLSRKVPNIYRISFGADISPAKAEKYWMAIIEVTLPFCSHLNDGLDGGIKNVKETSKVIQTFRSLVESTSAGNQEIYGEFSRLIKSP